MQLWFVHLFCSLGKLVGYWIDVGVICGIVLEADSFQKKPALPKVISHYTMKTL